MTHDALPAEEAERTVFLAWGPPAYTNRTRLLAERLGIDVWHVYSTRRRGALAAPVKYPYQAAVTLARLLWHRPRTVFVQSPPSLAVVVVCLYALTFRARFVVDAHSDAFVSPWWSRPAWLHRWVARRALTTIVTNGHFADRLRGWRAHATVVRDIPTEFTHEHHPLGPGSHVAVVATFAPDEPIGAVVEAARSLPEVRFHITGDTRRENAAIPADLPTNVTLTGYIDAPAYYGLLRGCDAVMVLTTRDHTMQRGACEALSVGTPVITSDWPLLVDYFNAGTVHVDNTPDGIAAGVETLLADRERYAREIVELRTEVEGEWKRARDAVVEAVMRP